MTPDQAKDKWCPFTRTPYMDRDGEIHPAAINRDYGGNPDYGARCLADGCMAWRWNSHQQQNGYCGLAGEGYT